MNAPYPRSIALAGASNFRDLGGYAAANGQPVRWRKLFRSDHLAALNAQDAATIQNLGIARAVDFRGVQESAEQAYALPGVRYLPLPIEPTVVQRAKEMAEAGETLTPAIARQLMQDTYRAFVSNNQRQFADLFTLLLDEQPTPLVFHCTAGKDRTGFAAALILSALGVNPETILQDYLLTNDLYRRPHAYTGSAPEEVMQVIWRVQADFLQASQEVLKRDYGGIQRYLEHNLGLTETARLALRERYLGAD